MDYKDYQKINENYFWHKARRDFIDFLLSKYLKNDSKSKKNILEIGCGTGDQIPIISKHGNYFGIEKDINAFEKAKNYKKEIYNVSLEELSSSEKYEAICLFDVLEHIENDFQALKKINNLISNKGRLFISVPAHQIIFSRHDLALKHYRRYNMKALKKMLEKNNFRIVKSLYWNYTLFPFIFMIRLFQKIIDKNKNQEKSDIQKINRIINSFLYTVLGLENFLIKLGFRPPFGLSIYIVAEKKYEN